MQELRPYGDSNLRQTVMGTMCKVSVTGPELYFYMVIAMWEGLYFPHCIARELKKKKKKKAGSILIEGGLII